METRSNPDGLSVLGHLEELRGRILASVLGLAAATGAGLVLAKPVIAFLKRPGLGLIQEFVLLKPTDVVAIYLKTGFYCGLLIASPLLAYQAWQFIKPAIPPQVKIRLPLWIVAVAALFAGGTAFSYMILIPQGLIFLMGLSREIATPMINLNDYISFVLSVLLVGGVVFEIPVLVGLLTRLQIVNHGMLRKRRKEAIFTLCVIAAIITPTTDIFNMLLFVVPMLALWELGIWISWAMARKSAQPIGKDIYGQ